ncbi:MAG: hypothetical protein AAF633_26055 [Chloroflexota bacterium]
MLETTIGKRERTSQILLLDKIKPESTDIPLPQFETYFMRFAFVIQGIERPFLPAFAMDDWGTEIRKLSIYQWLFQDGDQYPRTEIFGFEQEHNGSWIQTQRFLREFELGLKYPTFAVTNKSGFPKREDTIDGIGIIDHEIDQVIRVSALKSWPMPLKRTSVSVWRGSLDSFIACEALPLKL